ncbi:CYTH and CHAD domain-containing protein [Tepidimonas charontis]|uniref:CYTH and CHAD domain-containing protein n=1 Tax=Tepidimonas charontis TaxID=2267262 RepID=UPI001375FDAD|nr:CHAD domain-containing protein [Tepidimonas charontis]
MPQEIELKLALPGLDGAQVERALRSHPLLRHRPIQRLRLTNRYYDTPDGWLRQQRCALRVRGIERLDATEHALNGIDAKAPGGARQWEQTLKTAGEGALSTRGEWTTPLRRTALDTAALTNTPLGGLPDWEAQVAALRPVYETQCVRTLWTVRRRDGSVIEVALDVGRLRAVGRRAPLLELELELIEGDATALYELAARLGTRLPLIPARTSKAQQAQRLADGCFDAAVRARTPNLPRAADPATVARAALGDALGQLCDNLLLIARSDDPEAVHQARVGWRRWRSLLRLLRPWLPPPPDRAALRPLLDALGAVRDLDVAQTETLPAWADAFIEDATQHPERQRAVQRSLRALRHAAAQQRQRLRALLREPSVTQALLVCSAWLHALPARIDAPEDWAAERLRRWQQRLLRTLEAAQSDTGAASLAPAATPADAPEAPNVPAAAPAQPAGSPDRVEILHAARLLAKRLRYGAEAVAPTLGGRLLRRLLRWQRHARDWQTRIGAQRDLQLAAQWLTAHGQDPAWAAFVRGAAAALRRLR